MKPHYLDPGAAPGFELIHKAPAPPGSEDMGPVWDIPLPIPNPVPIQDLCHMDQLEQHHMQYGSWTGHQI